MSEEIQVPYMDEFERYLSENEGLAKKTVKRHVLNAEGFIYYMSTHGYEADPCCKEEELPMDDVLLRRGIDFINTYFSYFLPLKCFATPGTLRESGGSIKKLYKFLSHEGIVSEEQCKEILDEIKYGMSFWIEGC